MVRALKACPERSEGRRLGRKRAISTAVPRSWCVASQPTGATGFGGGFPLMNAKMAFNRIVDSALADIVELSWCERKVREPLTLLVELAHRAGVENQLFVGTQPLTKRVVDA